VPLTFGHEFSGVVEQVGGSVTKYKQGDRVVVQPIIYDGTCGACKAGQINCCYSNGFVGLSGFGGGLSEHIVLDESFLHHLPDNVPLDIGGKLYMAPFPVLCPNTSSTGRTFGRSVACRRYG
jgi:threonine dehydrogenase-like Zn-dependent dehydrogenase